jgi:hypothetical protein
MAARCVVVASDHAGNNGKQEAQKNIAPSGAQGHDVKW